MHQALPPPVTQAFVRASELAKYLGVSQRTMRRWIASGRVQAVQAPQPRHYADFRERKTSRGYWRVSADEAERVIRWFRGR